jgi:hypothetical protein
MRPNGRKKEATRYRGVEDILHCTFKQLKAGGLKVYFVGATEREMPLTDLKSNSTVGRSFRG